MYNLIDDDLAMSLVDQYVGEGMTDVESIHEYVMDELYSEFENAIENYSSHLYDYIQQKIEEYGFDEFEESLTKPRVQRNHSKSPKSMYESLTLSNRRRVVEMMKRLSTKN